MHAVDIFIVIAIGQVVGWVATIYVECDHRRLGLNLIVTSAGAFLGGYLSLSVISETSKFSMIFCAFAVAIFLFIGLRFRKIQSEIKRIRETGINWSDISVREHLPSILMALIVVVGIFLAIGWLKSLQIRDGKVGFYDIEAAQTEQS